MKKITLIGLLLALTASNARASYVNSCVLDGVVLNPTSTAVYSFGGNGFETHEESKLDVEVVIKQARPDGRADSGCTHFIGKKLNISINQPPLIMLKKGDTIKIRYFAKDGKSLPYSESYSLILD